MIKLINIGGCWTSLYFRCRHNLLTFQLFSRYQSRLSWPQFLSLLVSEVCSKALCLGARPPAGGCNVTRAPPGWTGTQLPEIHNTLLLTLYGFLHRAGFRFTWSGSVHNDCSGWNGRSLAEIAARTVSGIWSIWCSHTLLNADFKCP